MLLPITSLILGKHLNSTNTPPPIQVLQYISPILQPLIAASSSLRGLFGVNPIVEVRFIPWSLDNIEYKKRAQIYEGITETVVLSLLFNTST